MGRTTIRRKADELLGYGYAKQRVVELLLLELPHEKPRQVAKVVRYRPTILARERYNGVHTALMLVIVLYGMLRVLKPVMEGVDWSSAYRLFSLAPIATVLLGWSIYRWQGQVFGWVGWVNVLGLASLPSAITETIAGDGDPWKLSFSVLSISIGGMALYLAHRVFPKFREERDPLGIAPPIYVFPEETIAP
ncbi:MAG: hypothetical protein H6591_08665 [Flavobacteriales bacterium]|nr:hypothetical protein [Flavobacteriales bacterium]